MANVAKRSHKDSSDSEKDVKKRRYEEFSEEEEDEEHDEEEDGPWKWNVEDSHRLLISIMFLLPQCDVEPYSEQEAKIDWEKVAFSSFTADQCREHWRELTKKVRLYRTMSDLVVDALSLLPRPSSSFQMIQKYNQTMNLKPKPIKKKSSLPKMVINSFSLFMQEKIKTLQHIPATERMKQVSQLYKLLSETEKNELNERYEEIKRNHIKVLKKLKEDKPLLAEEVDAQIKKLEKIPGKPKKPKSSVVNQNNSILKYMNKEKTTPAQTVVSSERKRSNTSSGRSPKKSSPVKSTSIPSKSKAIDDESDESSDDFGKKSASKPQSTKAAEEEDSSTSDSSDNKEERNPSNGRSPKKSVPVKSASRPQKFKAMVEKPVSDHSSSEDEEEKQRPKPPKKGHSAIQAVVSQKKLSKPSQSKKKKKKEDVVTGVTQYVTTKMATYRQIHPELNDREIAMKLARKWERLPDKKKKKYEKLALKKMASEEVD